MTKKEKARDRYLRNTYGLTLRGYRLRFDAQGGKCDLCKGASKNSKRSLHVDHNHKTGMVRGLVCYYCNKFRIGRHNLESARALLDYMERHRDSNE